jgi:hypothetical protein
MFGVLCLLAACFDGGDSGGGAGVQASGSSGVSGGVSGAPIGGVSGAAGMGTGLPTAGTSGGVSGGVAGGANGAAGMTAGTGTGGAAGSDGAGAGGMGGDAGHGGDGADGVCDLACDPGTHCELVEVQCIKAPCPPLPECVEDPHCGGFAGFPCPGMGHCQDDPRDDCDPMMGGADCGGICACHGPVPCPDGLHWDGSPAVCACVEGASDGGGSVTCGDATCDKDMVCCNASCGICAAPDEACTQQACL